MSDVDVCADSSEKIAELPGEVDHETAARLLEVSASTVRRWVLDGTIATYRVDGRVMLSRASVEDLRVRLSDTWGRAT